MKDILLKPLNYILERLSGIEMHYCHECREYKFGSWMQAAFAEIDECGCYRRKKRPEVRYIWVCILCRERLASFDRRD